MKRTTLLSLAFFGVLAATSSGRAEDSLFSHTPINSVFVQPGAGGAGGPAGQNAPPAAAAPSPRLEGAPALAELVGKSGLDAKVVSENVVSTKIQHETWSFPALVTTSDDRRQVILVLLLSVVKDEQSLPAAKLLELMNANRDHAPAFFAYSSKRKRIELYRTLDNNNVAPEQVRGEITRLAEIAAKTQGLWKLESSPAASGTPATGKPLAKNAAPGKPAAPQSGNATAAPASGNPLVGRWSASRSKTEAFAMQLKADGSFVLVHVNQGKQTRSSGKFTLAGTLLTLAGSDGSKLAGNIGAVSAKDFQFQPTSGKAGSLTFKKAS
jgi:hypothetical protein